MWLWTLGHKRHCSLSRTLLCFTCCGGSKLLSPVDTPGVPGESVWQQTKASWRESQQLASNLSPSSWEQIPQPRSSLQMTAALMTSWLWCPWRLPSTQLSCTQIPEQENSEIKKIYCCFKPLYCEVIYYEVIGTERYMIDTCIHTYIYLYVCIYADRYMNVSIYIYIWIIIWVALQWK